MPTASECLEPGFLSTMVPIAALHQIAELRVDLPGVEAFAVDLGALVEIDVERIGIAEAAAFLRDVEEALLGAAAQTLGVHPHVMGEMLLLGRGHARHTRTSSS